MTPHPLTQPQNRASTLRRGVYPVLLGLILIAWVTAIENMLSGENTGAAAALNIFEHDGERWRMVVHHAAPVLR